MAGTKIQDTDIMVLQKLGNYDIDEPNKPPGGDYPNLKYDLQLFHYTGEDLKFTVGEYLDDFHKYVRLTGDEMTGNLSIKRGDTNNEVAAKLTLDGYKSNSDVCGVIVFQNSSWGRTFQVRARLDPDPTALGSVDFDNKVAMTENGGITMRCNSAKAGTTYSKNTISAQGTGRLSYQSSHYVEGQLEASSVRYQWDSTGWTHRDSDGVIVIKSDDGVNTLCNANTVIVEWHDDYAKYLGDISDGDHLVNKDYVDDQDALYVPLAGTSDENGHVYGNIKFDYTSGNTGSLDGAVGSPLVLKQNNVVHMTIGGTVGNAPDSKIHIYKTVNVHSNPITNVKFPEDTLYGVNTNGEDLHAVPKSYVDIKDQNLSDRIDNIGGIYTPTGMINAYVGETDPAGWFICNAENAGKSWDQLDAIAGRECTVLKAMLPNGIPDLSGRFLGMLGGAMGPTLNTKQSQSTAFPSTVGDNINLTHDHGIIGNDVRDAMHYTGSHLHELYGVTGGGSAQQHTDGNRALASGSDSNNWRSYQIPTENWSGDMPIGWAGNHRHSFDTFRTQPWGGRISPNDFDTYTRPNSYTINWIIKHD